MTAPSHPDFTKISLADAAAASDAAARDAQSAFGGLTAAQLNWKPDEKQWSVAQCLQHLIASNEVMVRDARQVMSGSSTLWQRVSPLSGFFGRMMVSTQGPVVTRKYSAFTAMRPAVSGLPADIVQRFVDQHVEHAGWMRGMRDDEAGRKIMTSPFVKVITYSVLDACRLITSHDLRHLGQARRVMETDGFPN